MIFLISISNLETKIKYLAVALHIDCFLNYLRNKTPKNTFFFLGLLAELKIIVYSVIEQITLTAQNYPDSSACTVERVLKSIDHSV